MKKVCHVHTTISHDGISSMEEYLEWVKGYDIAIFHRRQPEFIEVKKLVK